MFVPVSPRSLLVFLLAFSLSVAIRAPMLDRPLSGHHEFCTAFSLILLENWYTDGIAQHHGAPVITFSSDADRGAPWMGSDHAERDGRYYYLSHPALGLYLPYLWFQVLGQPPTVIGLQAFNLLFHLLTAIGLFLLIRAVVGDRSERAPLFAAVLYLFMPAPLWFHGNVFMSDIFVVAIWVWHVVAAQRVFADADPGLRWRSLFGLSLALAVFAGWLGVLAAAVDLLLIGRRWKRGGQARSGRLALIVVGSTLIPLMITAWTYAGVVGAEGLLGYLKGRLMHRSSTTGIGDEGMLLHVKRLLMNYRTGFLPVLLLVLAAIPGLLRAQRSGMLRVPPAMWVFIALTTGPVLLEHILLLEYADHDFAALKGGLFLCGSAALLLDHVGKLPWAKRFLGMVLLVLCGFGAWYFHRINGEAGTTVHRDQGTYIAEHLQADERFFWSGPAPDPQLVWYAKRTPWSVRNESEARSILAARGERSGVLFRPATDGSGLEMVRVLPALPE
jgi:hypothetical protein